MEMQGLWEMQPRNVDTAELGVPLHALGILEELAWLLGIPIFHGAEESKVQQGAAVGSICKPCQVVTRYIFKS